MSKHYGIMIGSNEALSYVETMLPDMLGELDPETADYYEKFVHRIRYLVDRDTLAQKPKYTKYRSKVGGYWTCSNCGYLINEVHFKYCPNCGFRLNDFPHYEVRNE